MRKVRFNKKNKKGMALSQILLLIFGTIAFSYALGSSIGVVSAGEPNEHNIADDGGAEFRYSHSDTDNPNWFYVGPNKQIVVEWIGGKNNNPHIHYERQGGSWISTDGSRASTQCLENLIEFGSLTSSEVGNICNIRTDNNGDYAIPAEDTSDEDSIFSDIQGSGQYCEISGKSIEDVTLDKFVRNININNREALAVQYGLYTESQFTGTEDQNRALLDRLIQECGQQTSTTGGGGAQPTSSPDTPAETPEGSSTPAPAQGTGLTPGQRISTLNTVIQWLRQGSEDSEEGPGRPSGPDLPSENAINNFLDEANSDLTFDDLESSCQQEINRGLHSSLNDCIRTQLESIGQESGVESVDITTDTRITGASAETTFGISNEKLARAGKYIVALGKDVFWAGTVYTASRTALNSFFPEQTGIYDPDALSAALATSSFVFQRVFRRNTGKGFSEQLAGKGKELSDTALGNAYGKAIPLAIVTFAVTYALFYKKEQTKVASFECVPWQPPQGGSDCSECGQGELPCSEYQCRSLGQSCELLNSEQEGEAVCVNVAQGDTSYPTIQAWNKPLIEGYTYRPAELVTPDPNDRGVEVLRVNENGNLIDEGKVPPFTPLSVGVTLDEPAKCKIDNTRKQSFGDMNFLLSNGLYKQNHSYALNIPGPNSTAGIEIDVSGEQELFVRCEDANGNSNPATFVFKFEVDDGPDETPPLIVGTDLANNMPVASGVTSTTMDVHINEPVQECRWSHTDQSLNNMEEENILDCSEGDEVIDMNNQGLFKCEANLTGIKNNFENKFYFRCRDNSDNVMTESHEFTLRGTQSLAISSASPNETTIKDSTDSIKVTLQTQTSAGANEGQATCYYKESNDNEENYVEFLNTDSFEHSQNLWLSEGSYDYDIRCVDAGGNADSTSITFSVESDNEAPSVTRAYHEEDSLKIVTDETAECVYDIVDCNYPFEDGISMTTVNDITHFTDWSTDSNFYIKCRDRFGNLPNPDQCSITVRPLEE